MAYQKKSVGRSQEAQRRIFNAKINLCAKRFEISALVALADKKFVLLVQDTFSTVDFYPPVKLLFEELPAGTMALRNQVVRICVAYMNSVTNNPHLVKLLRKHKLMAWTLLEEKEKDEEVGG